MFKISRMGLRASFVLMAALVASVSAEAATIDFGADTWTLADNTGSFSIADVTATAGPAGARLSHTAGLGLGIDYAIPATISFDDESPTQIDQVEVLTISFATPSLLDSFTVSNLFRETTCERGCGGQHYEEVGYYSIDGGSWLSFTAGNAGNGRQTVQLGGISVSEIAFSTGTMDPLHDFSLQSIETTEVARDVAEPTSMMLVGAGLLIGASRLRRRK